MYEYKEITNNQLHETAELVLQLNDNAKEGWRCVAVTSTNMGRTAILERQIPDLAKVSATVNKIADNIVKYKKKHAEEETK